MQADDIILYEYGGNRNGKSSLLFIYLFIIYSKYNLRGTRDTQVGCGTSVLVPRVSAEEV